MHYSQIAADHSCDSTRCITLTRECLCASVKLHLICTISALHELVHNSCVTLTCTHVHVNKPEALLLFQNNCLRGNKPEAVVLLGNVKFNPHFSTSHHPSTH